MRGCTSRGARVAEVGASTKRQAASVTAEQGQSRGGRSESRFPETEAACVNQPKIDQSFEVSPLRGIIERKTVDSRVDAVEPSTRGNALRPMCAASAHRSFPKGPCLEGIAVLLVHT